MYRSAALLLFVALVLEEAVAVLAAADFPPSLFAHAGFLNANVTSGVKLQYWFFPAAEKPGNGSGVAPTMLWLNGGPGCSDTMGLFYENGPFHLDERTLSLVPNPNTWQKRINMLYIDSPCGTGFSDCGSAGLATDETRVASDLHGALLDFFSHPSRRALGLSGGEFFVFGESYAGKYIPALTSYLLAHPDPIFPKLAGIGIGNGLVDPVTQVSVYADFAYNLQLCDSVQAEFLRGLQHEAVKLIHQEQWLNANVLFNNITFNMLQFAGWPDPADVRYYGFDRLDFSAAEKFMELPEVRAKLGVPKGSTPKFSICADAVAQALAADEMKSVKPIITRLLDDTDVRVLLFTGNFDPTLPVPEHWISTIPWKHQHAFRKAARSVWTNATGSTAGYIKRVENLKFVVVVQAGHMAVGDQPGNTQQMAYDFVFNG